MNIAHAMVSVVKVQVERGRRGFRLQAEGCLKRGMDLRQPQPSG
jgi:hypothetical protein